MVVLKNCQPQLSYILANLSKMYLKESFFLDCSKVSFVVSIFKNVGEGFTTKTTALLFFFLWLVKSLKILVNNRFVDHIEKCGLRFDY